MDFSAVVTYTDLQADVDFKDLRPLVSYVAMTMTSVRPDPTNLLITSVETSVLNVSALGAFMLNQ